MEMLIENYQNLALHFVNVVIAGGLVELGVSGWQKRPFEKKKAWYAMIIMTGINLLIR